MTIPTTTKKARGSGINGLLKSGLLTNIIIMNRLATKNFLNSLVYPAKGRTLGIVIHQYVHIIRRNAQEINFHEFTRPRQHVLSTTTCMKAKLIEKLDGRSQRIFARKSSHKILGEIPQEFLCSCLCVTSEIFMYHAPESKFQFAHKTCTDNVCPPLKVIA
jgi:hypothetical protein